MSAREPKNIPVLTKEDITKVPLWCPNSRCQTFATQTIVLPLALDILTRVPLTSPDIARAECPDCHTLLVPIPASLLPSLYAEVAATRQVRLHWYVEPGADPEELESFKDLFEPGDTFGN